MRPARVGMYCLIAAEAAMFTIFIVAYLFYAGTRGGPSRTDVLQAPVLATICLLSSSATIHLAVRSWQRGMMAAFACWWLATIALGALFLAGTALEWRRLIYHDGLTIATSLFGTTYFSLVGLHALHVTIGLLCMSVVAALAYRGYVRAEDAGRGEVLSLYWHFVDGVWVVVFMVVYVIGR